MLALSMFNGSPNTLLAAAAAAAAAQALEKADGIVENITWELFKETLLEQAEQVWQDRVVAVFCCIVVSSGRLISAETLAGT
jgi:hypothetical protein